MNDGGYAFPTGNGISGGMSLRDYFAIRVPEPSEAAIKQQVELDRLKNPHGDSYKPERRSWAEIVADLRYARADAMIARRML